MEQHVAKVEATCFYHLRRLRQIRRRRRVGTELTTQLILDFIIFISARLLQLRLGRLPAVHTRASTTSSKRCSKADSRTGKEGTWS